MPNSADVRRSRPATSENDVAFNNGAPIGTTVRSRPLLRRYEGRWTARLAACAIRSNSRTTCTGAASNPIGPAHVGADRRTVLTQRRLEVAVLDADVGAVA